MLNEEKDAPVAAMRIAAPVASEVKRRRKNTFYFLKRQDLQKNLGRFCVEIFMAMRQLYPDSFSKFFSLPGWAASPMDEMLIREGLMQRRHEPTADLAIWQVPTAGKKGILRFLCRQ